MRLTQIKIWNSYDEFGLLNGLGRWSTDDKTLEGVRYPTETNKRLRDRTKEAAKHRGNGTIQGMINNINRDLDISASGGDFLSWYNSQTKTIFYLSEAPYPGPSGVRVYISTSGSWSDTDEIIPQIRASGYIDATSGWIVWNQPDYDPAYILDGLPGSSGWYDSLGISGYSNATRYGSYSQILEFIGTSVPQTDDYIRVDYIVQSDTDELGTPILNWRSDFKHPDDNIDTSFIGQKSDIPTTSGAFIPFVTSGHVAVYGAYDIGGGPVSGFYYYTNGRGTDKLIQLKKLIDDNYPLTWGKFKYDIGRWDQLENASIGQIPSFHDQALPEIPTDFYNGTRYGTDLDMVGVEIVSSGARDAWYPKFEPGEFHMGSGRYYLFAKLSSENLILTDIGGSIYSGAITLTSTNMPYEFDTIAGNTSGRFYDDSDLPDNPYIKRLHDFSAPLSGVLYRTNYLDVGSGVIPANINFDNGYAFYYDYDSGCVFASGLVDPTGFILFWEHSSVATSGSFVTFSGGYGFTTPNLNPLVNPEDKFYTLS